jgi:hypothetical protein
MVILRLLVCQILYWIKSYDILLVKIFFSCLKTHHFWGSLRVSFDLSEQNQLSYFQNGLYSIQRRNIPHFKAFGMSNFKYEVRICHKICIKGTIM